MTRKALVISAVTAALVAAAVLLAIKAFPSGAVPVPERLTVYLKDEETIISMEYNSFIEGCVFGLISPKSEKEALKSAACAVSTLALYRMSQNSGFSNNGADITAGSGTEFPYSPPQEIAREYGERADYYAERVRAAVEAATGYVITYSGEPIYAAMCESSAGATDSGEEHGIALAYLVSVAAEEDTERDGWESVAAFTPRMVRSALAEYAPAVMSGSPADWFGEAELLSGGTVKEISFCGAEVSGAAVMAALGLRSAAFTVEYTEDLFRYTVHGCGENLGMSLSCADSFALHGMSMEEILAYFYPETTLSAAG